MSLSTLLTVICLVVLIMIALAATDDVSDDRKLAAKRLNERIKLIATALNAIGLGILGASLIIPTFGSTPGEPLATPPSAWAGTAAYALLFSMALMIYRFMRSEDEK